MLRSLGAVVNGISNPAFFCKQGLRQAERCALGGDLLA